jgi:hypothetical protein
MDDMYRHPSDGLYRVSQNIKPGTIRIPGGQILCHSGHTPQPMCRRCPYQPKGYRLVLS